MATPTTAVAALVVAVYAALISTITGLVQVFNYRRDRSQVQLKVGHKMVITDPWREGLTIVTVMNRGRRPVTITTVGAQRLYPHNPIVIPETHPALPHGLTEGKSLIAVIPPCDLDMATIAWWETYDAVGRPYRLYVAPWPARLRSAVQWRFQYRRLRRAKAAKA